MLLDARKICSFTDYLVICHGDSERQVQAIYDEVLHTLKRQGVPARHVEGTVDSGWLLLDFGDVVVHVFGAFEREYYQLDELWRQAVPVVRIQ